MTKKSEPLDVRSEHELVHSAAAGEAVRDSLGCSFDMEGVAEIAPLYPEGFNAPVVDGGGRIVAEGEVEERIRWRSQSRRQLVADEAVGGQSIGCRAVEEKGTVFGIRVNDGDGI